MGEAEGFYSAKCYLNIQGYFWDESNFEFIKRGFQKVVFLKMYRGGSVLFVHPVNNASIVNFADF